MYDKHKKEINIQVITGEQVRITSLEHRYMYMYSNK